MKMRGWKCGDESAKFKVRWWKCKDESARMKVWGWKCEDENAEDEKSEDEKARGWKTKDESERMKYPRMKCHAAVSTASTYPNFSKNASCEGVNCPLNPIIIILQLTNQARVAKIAVSYGRQAGYCLFLRQKCTLARFFDDELCYFRWESQHILLACKCIE